MRIFSLNIDGSLHLTSFIGSIKGLPLHSTRIITMDVFWFVIIYSLFVAPQQVEANWEQEPYDHSLDEFDEWPF
jgi:hypothetical protein